LERIEAIIACAAEQCRQFGLRRVPSGLEVNFGRYLPKLERAEDDGTVTQPN